MDDIGYWYAISAMVLLFKMFAISLDQGYHRIGKQAFVWQHLPVTASTPAGSIRDV